MTHMSIDEAIATLEEAFHAALTAARREHAGADAAGMSFHKADGQEGHGTVECHDCHGFGASMTTEDTCYRTCQRCHGQGSVSLCVEQDCCGLEPYQRILETLDTLHAEAVRMRDHVHEWNLDSYCNICGADGSV